MLCYYDAIMLPKLIHNYYFITQLYYTIIYLHNYLFSSQITYIRQIVGRSPISKCLHLFFAPEFILEINWDGLQKKVAIKNTELFSKFVFSK